MSVSQWSYVTLRERPLEKYAEIRVFRKSLTFPDFLQDPDRWTDSRFFIDSLDRGKIALNLPERLEDNRYACGYCQAMRIRSSPTTDTDLLCHHVF